MSNSLAWNTSELNETDAAINPVSLPERALSNRLDNLREVALTLLREVESIRVSQQPETNRPVKLYDEVQRFEIELIRSALLRTGHNQSRAAQLLGVKLTTLNTKIKRYKILPVGYCPDVNATFSDQLEPQETAA
jgi:transcriptional regulator with PAS, ATPase and Fis domain